MKSAKFLHCKKVAKFYAHSKVKGNQEFIMRRVKIMETDSGVNSSSHSLEIFTSDFGDEDDKSLSGLSVSKNRRKFPKHIIEVPVGL